MISVAFYASGWVLKAHPHAHAIDMEENGYFIKLQDIE